MRAIAVEEFGDADVLELRDWDSRAAGPGEVLIEGGCAGVNFGEIMSRRHGCLGVQPPFVPGI